MTIVMYTRTDYALVLDQVRATKLGFTNKNEGKSTNLRSEKPCLFDRGSLSYSSRNGKTIATDKTAGMLQMNVE